MKENFYINDAIIQKTKQIDFPHFLRKKNIELFSTNSGSSYKCLCPFHDDKEPSLNLTFKEGVWLWNCFGCNSGGTVIDFIMKYDSVDFKEAIKSIFPETSKYPNQIKKIKEVVTVSLEERINLLDTILNHYHKILTNGDTKGKAYLEKRGLLDMELIKTFKLGFSDGNAKYDLKEHRTDLKEKIGIFTGSYHENFANCVIFPVLNEQNKPTDLYGRRVIDYTDRANHCYNKGKHIGIFNYANVKDSETIILTESIIDALSIYKAGFKNVTALYGVSGFTEKHEEFFKNTNIREVIFAFDNDEAGKKATNEIAKRLTECHSEQGEESRIFKTVCIPESIKDINELLIAQGVEAVKKAVENAEIIKPIPQIKRINAEEEGFPTSGNDFSPITSNKESEKIKPELNHRMKILDSSGIPQNDSSIKEQNIFGNAEKFSYFGKDLNYQTDSILYVIKNVLNLKELDSLRFIITANYKGETYRDRIDLYLSRSRKGFEIAASKAFNLQPAVIENDLSKIVDFIEKDFAAQRTSKEALPQKKELTEKEKHEAFELLKSPDLIKQILEDITSLGYIGEDANKLLLYLGATSRLLDKAISILIRSQSSSGKSYLIKLICNLLPAEDVHKWTRATPQALYYMPEDALKHKFIAIDEKEGIEEAEYPIRSLQSEGSITLSVPIKNPTTGQTVTEMIVKEGPIAYVDGSTDTRVNPENANRCFEIYLDESELQTQHIHKAQKQEYELNALANNILKETIKRKHQNAQRLLKPVKVIIPYVNEIKFPTDRVRTRRDHDRFLLLIACITFLHQYQRDVRKYNAIEYIEANIKDYAIAYKIASVVIFNTFQELEKPVFDFYFHINKMVEDNAKEQGINPDEYFFTRRMVRSYTKLPDYLVKRYMRTLSDLEYLTFKGDKQGSRFIYRLIKNINEKQKIEGLLTPEELRYTLNEKQNTKDITNIRNVDLQ